MTYLLKRGKGSRKRVAHLAVHDRLTGAAMLVAVCGEDRVAWDMTSNVPWGRPLCKRCRRSADV
jgi:hypothetical protein